MNYHLQDIKLISIITMVIVSIILIITSVTLGISFNKPTARATTNDSIFVAAGTGNDPLFITGLQLDIPFSKALYKQGNAIGHNQDEAQFNILESGNYEIYYQLATYNPVIEKSEPIEMKAELISDKLGVLDTVQFDKIYEVKERKVVVTLEEGDILKIECSQPQLTELLINSQSIVIRKVN